MGHPQMFDDADPYLARLRAICARFPGATETVSHGRPTFRTAKIFVTYGGGTKGPSGTRESYDRSIIVLPDAAERPALEQDEHYYLPAYYGPYGWIGWHLAHDGATPEQVDWDEVFELVDASYRQVSPARLVAEWDAASPPSG
ncbi:MmcQ/YjbR family DNA-binding protein [Occultella kanbiaonis]|uniref:MmcQ/YjbR family DNA-binding protein n=1 Tax=Occultella kanbiaonis TaxID=2675754 RepID=UPI0012B9160A|nr:MmcQ/YjbR family DNA-binding protein [Occultella kanbiaonis]